MGSFFEHVKKDAEEAVKWYKKSAEHKSAEAQCKLGECYRRGIGVPKDAEESFKWYELAAEQKHPEALYQLGKCLLREGDDKNAAKSFKACG